MIVILAAVLVAAAVAVSAFQVSFLSPHSISMINELRRETELAGQNQNVSTWHLELELEASEWCHQ
jgi:hypothetical protein